jgi:hypothetical protein
VSGYSSTTAWKEDNIVEDYYALTWPAWLPSAEYTLQIGLFPRFSSVGLPVNSDKDNWFSIITQPFGTIPSDNRLYIRTITPLQALYGDDFWLLGIDSPNEVTTSKAVMVDLMTECHSDQSRTFTPQFLWVAVDGSSSISAYMFEQSSGKKTVDDFLCNNQVEVRRYKLSAPPSSGNFNLRFGLGSEEGITLPARCRWVSRTGTSCVITRVTVNPADSDIANYDNRLLLTVAEVDESGIYAGGALSVSLQWRGLRTIENDYTMFLQVIGPDGKIYGQVDSWPQQGGRPTSGWIVGEEIYDTYNVYIKGGAPRGQYSIILGWYLLADMHRLPVVDGTGQAINDFYTLGTFTLE